MNDEIIYIKLDDWNDMKLLAASYLKELESGEHDNEINYCEVWYDMAIIYCITTTRHYVDMHPELEEHICKGTYFEKHDIFRPYFPDYDPKHFGCAWYGEYKGWAPYKEFNKKTCEHCVKQGLVDEEGNINNMNKNTYTLADILNVSKSHGGEWKHFVIDCYEKGLINMYHTWDDIDYWIPTTIDALNNVLEYPEIYTIRIELKWRFT